MSSRRGWKPYVSQPTRRARAGRLLAKDTVDGKDAAPVRIEGRAIANTFWGKAWCSNLEQYSDFTNRLPRGRTYARNGSVADLKITSGTAAALVIGSEFYRVDVRIEPLTAARWQAACRDCAGAIESVVELLQGNFSNGVMTRLCDQQTGLFPAPTEITFSCSCPDWAAMCKHVAAVLYGIGARLDSQPELLFLLRQVNQQDLIVEAGVGLARGGTTTSRARVLTSDNLSAIFGIDIAEGSRSGERPPKKSKVKGGKRLP